MARWRFSVIRAIFAAAALALAACDDGQQVEATAAVVDEAAVAVAPAEAVPVAVEEGSMPLQPDDAVDLYALIAAGSVSVEATGAGVAAVSVSLRNLTAEPIRAVVPAGAYFQSADASVQNMVTTEPTVVWLPAAEAPTTATIAAACANLHLDEPGSEHGLTLASAPVSGDIARVVAAAAALELPARQAAVWIMTDDATYDELSVLNTMSPAYAAQGARLVAESGVDLASRRIWDDLPYLLAETLEESHEDEALWLWNALGRPLQPEPNPDPQTDEDYVLPYLAEAAYCGCLQLIDALIEAGADPDQRFVSSDGERVALRYVADRATAERLLAAGATLDGRALWERAAAIRSVELVALLQERGEPAPADAPLLALARDDEEMIRILLDEGASVSPRGEFGRTPLHNAIYDSGAVALLLAAGADPVAVDDSGLSVLRVAVDQGVAPEREYVVRRLIEAGADPLERSASGDTLLHRLALLGGDVPTLQLLLAAGVDPNATNDEGRRRCTLRP